MKELTPEQEDLIGDLAHHDKKCEEENEMVTKELNKCYDWWDNLTEEEQFKIMTDYYPTEVKEDTDIDKMFGDMPDSSQLWIYRREKKHKMFLNPEKLDLIQKFIGRKKLDDNETYSDISGKIKRQ